MQDTESGGIKGNNVVITCPTDTNIITGESKKKKPTAKPKSTTAGNTKTKTKKTPSKTTKTTGRKKKGKAPASKNTSKNENCDEKVDNRSTTTSDATSAPSTPTKRKYTTKMAPELLCQQAHETGVNLRNYDGQMGYFNPGYLAKFGGTKWPNKCSDCGIAFVNKRESDIEDKDKEYSVKNGVYLCPNAALTHHRCLFALCRPCKQTRFGATPTKRSRTERVLYDS